MSSDGDLTTQHDKIFCSFASKDDVIVTRVVRELEKLHFFVWRYKGMMYGGGLWKSQIVAEITGSKAVLLILSRQSVRSGAVLKELSLASSQEKPIIPVVIEKVDIPQKMAWDLEGKQKILLHENFDEGMRQIKAALENFDVKSIETGDPMPTPSPWWESVPLLFSIAGALGIVALWGIHEFFPRPNPTGGLAWWADAEPGIVGLVSGATFGFVSWVLLQLWRRVGKDPPVWGLVIYLLLMLPAVLFLGHWFAAGLVFGSVVVIAAWTRGRGPLLRPRLVAIQAVILFGLPLIGVAAEQVELPLDQSPPRQLTVAAFGRMGLESEDDLVAFSESFREALTNIVHGAYYDVSPDIFNSATFSNWTWKALRDDFRDPGLRTNFLITNKIKTCDGEFMWIAEAYPGKANLTFGGEISEFDLVAHAAVFRILERLRHKTMEIGEDQELPIYTAILSGLQAHMVKEGIANSERGLNINAVNDALASPESLEASEMPDLLAPLLPNSSDYCSGHKKIQEAYRQNYNTY